MSKKTNIVPISEPAPVQDLTHQLAAHVSRFQGFHGLVQKSVLEMKLAKYFAGLEVNALYDLHEEMHGETRGRPSSEENTDSLSVISLEDFLEQHLNVTARTARRYRTHFLAITQEAPQIAEKLNSTWKQLALGDGAQPTAEGAALMLQNGGSSLNTEALQVICNQADEWGLHELFEVPERNVGPHGQEEDDSADKKAKKAALLQFWTVGLVRRLEQDELLRLPAPSLEAVLAKIEEAAKKAREILAAKAAKKKGGRTK